MKQKLYCLLFGFAAGGIMTFFAWHPEKSSLRCSASGFYGTKGDITMGVIRAGQLLDISLHQQREPFDIVYNRTPSQTRWIINNTFYADMNGDGIADIRTDTAPPKIRQFIRIGSRWQECATIDSKAKIAVFADGRNMKFTDRWREMQ